MNRFARLRRSIVSSQGDQSNDVKIESNSVEDIRNNEINNEGRHNLDQELDDCEKEISTLDGVEDKSDDSGENEKFHLTLDQVKRRNSSFTWLIQSSSFVNGIYSQSKPPDSFSVYSSGSSTIHSEVVQVVDNCSLSGIHDAVDAARDSGSRWKSTSKTERRRVLLDWIHEIIKHELDLCCISALESGISVYEAHKEFQSVLDALLKSLRAESSDSIQLSQPLGIVGILIPWNISISNVLIEVFISLMHGNTVILHPSYLTPLFILALARLAQEAHVPNGVFNVIASTNRNSVVSALSQRPEVRMISFYGSLMDARTLVRHSAIHLQRVSTQIHGLVPCIVFEDADLTHVVDHIMQTRLFKNAGQSWSSMNRIFVEECAHDRLLSHLLVRIERLLSADSRGGFCGKLIDQNAIENARRLVADAVSEGAVCMLGGDVKESSVEEFQPTLITGVDDEMAIAREHTLAPIVAISVFNREDEVVARSSSFTDGSAAFVFTLDLEKAHRVASKMSYNAVGINTTNVLESIVQVQSAFCAAKYQSFKLVSSAK
mmetsp:Transcript_7325/g.13225  ORF Transcript_7325/g.13225 Transcript_7325/m.13225 type:complete len:547 (-) Transcript_7325:806-2446(-)